MPAGLPWDENLIQQISDKRVRDSYVADQVHTRVALMIRALREQSERRWSQADLGRRSGKPQSVISRVEDPDYGRLTLETLLQIASAFDLPLLVDIPEWEDWFRRMRDVSARTLWRRSFDANNLISQARPTAEDVLSGYESQVSQPAEHILVVQGHPFDLITGLTTRQGIVDPFRIGGLNQMTSNPNWFGAPVSGASNVVSAPIGSVYCSGGIVPWAANYPISALPDPTESALLQRVNQLERLLAEKEKENRELSQTVANLRMSERVVKMEIQNNRLQDQRVPPGILIQ